MTIQNVPLTDLDRDLLLRQARVLYPDVEQWILEMSIEAYVNQLSISDDDKEDPPPQD